MMERIRITTDGTARGTRVYDTDGRPILRDCLKSVTWKVDRHGVPIAILEVICPELVAIPESGEAMSDISSVRPEWSKENRE